MSQAQLIPITSPFQFNEFPIRTQVEDGQFWFAAKDVCNALGIGWNGTTLSAIQPDWQGMRKFRTPSGNQTLRCINEPAVYKLAFRSNKPEADAFTNWVASEVLPSIRKTGKYETAPKKKALGRGIKALPEGKPAHVFKRMGLTPFEELQMGTSIKQMLEGLDMDKIGPHTMEALALKVKYMSAISEIYQLNRRMIGDLDRFAPNVNGAALRALNKNKCFSDPFMNTLYEARYRIDNINEEYRSQALAALNSNICLAMMLGV